MEEWYLKWQIETKKFDHFLNCLKSTKDTTWKKNDFKEHGNWYKTFPGADWNKKIARIPYPEQKLAIDCPKTRPNAHHMSKTGLFEWVCEWVTGPKTRGDRTSQIVLKELSDWNGKESHLRGADSLKYLTLELLNFPRNCVVCCPGHWQNCITRSFSKSAPSWELRFDKHFNWKSFPNKAKLNSLNS